MPSGCSVAPIRETKLDTGEGESFVSSHCLKSRDSLDGVGEEGTALEEVEEGGIIFEELGRVDGAFGDVASNLLALEDDKETSLERLREEDTIAGVGGDTEGVTVSSRFLKNFFGGSEGVGGEGGLGLDLLPLRVILGEGFSFSSSSTSSTLPFLPPCSSSSSTTTDSSFSLPLPLSLLALPLFCPGLGPGFLLDEARGGLSTALLTSLSLVTGSEPRTSSDAFKSASTC